MHCARLAMITLQKTIDQYQKSHQ
ncbi:MAG: hypothetical protein ACUVXA_20550 [Candidatus Jordarchaeum sp.]